MLTSVHFTYLFVVFLISVFLGLLLRVFYYSKSRSQIHLRMFNLTILMIAFPIIVYRNIIKHKTEVIRSINRNEKLTLKQKAKYRKQLNSNRKIAFKIFRRYVVDFKDILDDHIELLNDHKQRHGREVKLIRIEFVKKTETQFYQDKAKSIYATA